MRYRPEHKAETREQILDAAGHAFREDGLGGVGIASLMKRVGLTHGGFYSHFPSKDALVAAACARSSEDQQAKLFAAVDALPEDERFRALVGKYVSRSHRDQPGDGCIIPTLGADVARQPQAVRRSVAATIRGFLDRLTRYLPTRGKRRREDDALAVAASMVGAVVLARAVSADPELSERVLRATREMIARDFADPNA